MVSHVLSLISQYINLRTNTPFRKLGHNLQGMHAYALAVHPYEVRVEDMRLIRQLYNRLLLAKLFAKIHPKSVLPHRHIGMDSQ